IPVNQGIVGGVVTFQRTVNIPYDFFDDPRSAAVRQTDAETGYRTYTMLALPLLNKANEVVGVVQLINKLKSDASPTAPLAEKVDLNGFLAVDEQRIEAIAPLLVQLIELSQSAQNQAQATALQTAINALYTCSTVNLDNFLQQVMVITKQLVQADRSTFWLLDRERDQLWTTIPINDVSQEIRIPLEPGFAGQVARSGLPLLIPFDLYDHPDSTGIQVTDQRTGYRTCSQLCAPVLSERGEVIGVIQLINKTRPGYGQQSYDVTTYPEVPEVWRASFDQADQNALASLNGPIAQQLQTIQLREQIQQQANTQEIILRSLSNGLITTDREGRIITANENAKRLLGLHEQDTLEGQRITDVIQLERGDLSRWFERALDVRNAEYWQQYYPDQTLQPIRGELVRQINLTISTMTDTNDPMRPIGILVELDDITDAKRLKNTLYRYMTPELAEELLENASAASLGGSYEQVSVLFSSIQHYDTLVEQLQPEAVVELLNEYFESMVDGVFQYRGILNQYIGDRLMAIYGAPLPLEDHEWLAVRTALEMRERLIAFNSRRTDRMQEPLQIGIGIDSDRVISGNIGSSRRMNWTVTGAGVHFAAQLPDLCQRYGTDLLISETAYQPCANWIWARELDWVQGGGRATPTRIYQVIGLRDVPISDQQQRLIENYERGLSLYR
ncbi:MAG: adenylate/guanylate cyclase domain-containing protein, partial [Kovacikia sp.]